MSFFTDRHVRTGGDPRTLSDFTALRDEMGKLVHPARPDVDWHKVEQLSLALFRQNGVELQTAAYFTLARTQRTGLAGLEEGLSLVDGLLVHQWHGLWPLQTHARMEILAWLVARLQQTLRTLDIQYGDLVVVYRVETLLENACGILARLELKHLSQLDKLRQQIHNMAQRLESCAADGAIQETSPQPAVSLPFTEAPDAGTLVYVAQAVNIPAAALATAPARPPGASWRIFVAGMLTMALAGAMGLWGWHALQQEPLKAALMSAVAPLPMPLTVADRDTLTSEHRDQVAALETEMLPALQQQLARLNALPPLWVLSYGNQLIDQAEALWPGSSVVRQLAEQWRQQRTAQAFPVGRLTDWHQAQDRLQQLADKLNSLEETRGRYMTISALKSAVFAIQQPLLATPPLEELLRQLAQQQQQGQSAPALQTEIDRRFNQLLNRYALLVSSAAAPSDLTFSDKE